MGLNHYRSGGGIMITSSDRISYGFGIKAAEVTRLRVYLQVKIYGV